MSDFYAQQKSVEWYTPAKYIEAAREVMGGIDLDPASCELANRTVKATRYYTQEENGLTQDWTGRIWLNPPYGKDGDISNQERWTKRLIACYLQDSIVEAILLVNASTSTRWFQALWQFPICFTDHKIRFYNDGTGADSPTHGNAFVYLGPHEQKFIEVFSKFGRVARAIDTPQPKPVSLPLWQQSA